MTISSPTLSSFYTAGVKSFNFLVPRVATGNPLKQPEVLSTIQKAHWMPLKLTTFRLKILDEEGRCKSRFEIDQFSIVPNFEKWS
jgi:hypothetical protein